MAGVNYWIPKPELIGDLLLRRVASIRKHYGTYDDYQMAAAVGLPLEIYVGRLSWAQSQHTKDLKRWEVGAPLELVGDAMVIGDLHAPLTDYAFTALVSKIAAKHLQAPRRLIVGGDLFDLESFSTWKKLTNGPEWHDEQHAIDMLMGEWNEVFDEIVLLSGNHELRMPRATGGDFDITDLAKLIAMPVTKTKVSKFGYCFLKSGNEKWAIVHPSEYSAANQLGILNDYAQKYSCHILGFHAHLLNMDWDKWGRHIIINGGCLSDQDCFGYKTLVANRKPNWKLGFVMVKNGSPFLFGKSPFTDWSQWL
jgi:hypothetical protein